MNLREMALSTQIAPTRLGPVLTIAGGGQNSTPVWIRGVDEPTFTALEPVLNPQQIIRACNAFDATGRLAAEVISLQTTFDRVNWYTANQIFAATLGIIVQLNTAVLMGSRGFRFRATAGPVGAGGLTFATMITGA